MDFKAQSLIPQVSWIPLHGKSRLNWISVCVDTNSELMLYITPINLKFPTKCSFKSTKKTMVNIKSFRETAFLMKDDVHIFFILTDNFNEFHLGYEMSITHQTIVLKEWKSG